METEDRLSFGLKAQLAAMRLGQICLAPFGPGMTRRLAHMLAPLVWRVLPKRRQAALEGTAVLTDMSEQEQQRIAKQSVAHYCMSMFNLLRLDAGVWGRTEIADPDQLQALRAEKRPVILVSGHLGAWEILMGYLNGLLPGRPQLSLTYTQNSQAMQIFKTRQMKEHGAQNLPTANSMFAACSGLRQEGAVLSALIDQNTRAAKAVFLPLLGKTAAVTKGPALMALRAKALIWPVYLIRTPKKGYLLHLDPPLDPATLPGDNDAKILQTCEYYNSSLENMIRQYPEQWLWMHRRWKTQPPAENS